MFDFLESLRRTSGRRAAFLFQRQQAPLLNAASSTVLSDSVGFAIMDAVFCVNSGERLDGVSMTRVPSVGLSFDGILLVFAAFIVTAGVGRTPAALA